MRAIWSLCSATIGYTLLISNVQAQQVLPDGSLNTVVNSVGQNFTVLNGTNPQSGSNLFHSFREFSIPTGGSATFDLANTPNVATIFSRVTGANPSSIDGLLRINNTNKPVSLFLLNPNGIIFGANAKLNLNGSFIATTGNAIKFADGTELIVTNPAPLLTMSAPIGIQFGNQLSSITVNQTAGLSVKTDQTLALVGGSVAINGGNLTAPNGRIELGGVSPLNLVTLTSNNPGWTFNYDSVANFQDITLTQATRMNTNGSSGGTMQIQGRQIRILEGSQLAANTTGVGNGSGIRLSASDRLDISGATPDGKTLTSVRSQTQTSAQGRGGDITIVTPKLFLSGGAQIRTNTAGTVAGGDLKIQANEIDIQGRDASLDGPSGLDSRTEPTATGRGGNIMITAQRVQVRDGAAIKLRTQGASDAGDLTIHATDVILQGRTPEGSGTDISSNSREGAIGKGGNISITATRVSLNGTSLRAKTFDAGQAGTITVKANEMTVVDSQITAESGSTLFKPSSTTIGRGGDIRLNVDQLKFLDGGWVSASGIGDGQAGNIYITAQSLELAGKSPLNLSTSEPEFSHLEARSEGKASAGSIHLVTQRLLVRDAANISVSNLGSGDAGNLVIHAHDIRLDRQASLRAEVNAGKQGNINLNANLLLLRHGSNVTTTAFGTASGGNINLNTNLLVGLENSDIIANAIKGQGGNIAITAQGIFGSKFRPQLTPENDITASSEYGVNGIVQVNTVGVDPNSGLMQLPVDIIDPSQQIAKGCSSNQGSSFVVTGRGGLPQNPSEQVSLNRPWLDFRIVQPAVAMRPDQPAMPSAQPIMPTLLVEATSWTKDPSTGRIAILAAHPLSAATILTCVLSNR